MSDVAAALPQRQRNLPTAETVHVAHVLPWKAIGGTELATFRVAESAALGGYASVMVCRQDAPLVVDFFSSRGYDVVSFDAPSLEGGWLQRWRESRRVMRELRRRGVQVVHCADVYGGDFFAIAARVAGFQVVCHVRNRYEWLTREQRVWLRLVRKLVFVSKDTADRFGHLARGTRGLVASRRVVLYDGISAGEHGSIESARRTRNALRIPSNAIVIGMIARLSIQKDHLTLVEAARSVCERHPRAFFLFVGDDGLQGGAEPENVRRVMDAIAGSPFRDRFLCTGHRSDVPDLIAALDIFVLSTHREGLPLVILEAMAQEKPVVATAVDGIPEIVQHGVTGLLHTHEDAGSLADRLNELLDGPERMRTLARNGRDFVDRFFSQRVFAKNVASLYDDLVVPRSSPRVPARARRGGTK